MASTIKNTHELTCFDPNISENPMRELSCVLEKASPEVVALYGIMILQGFAQQNAENLGINPDSPKDLVPFIKI